MRNKNLILNYIFLSCLIVLFLNDHFLKFQYSNWLTGKLSDVVGIILFPMLLTFLFPKLKQHSVFAAGIFFIFWKSTFSEKFIELYNVVSPISIQRVVDYSDLMVLILLPIPYYLIKNHQVLVQFSLKKTNLFAVLLPTIFVLMSTSQPKKAYYYNPETGMLNFNKVQFEIKKTHTDLLDEFTKQNIVLIKDTARILESSRYSVSGVGEFNQQALKNGGDVFKIDNTELRRILLRNIAQSSDYKIEELKIGDRTLRNLTFTIKPALMNMRPKKFSEIEVHGVQIDKNLDQDKVAERLKEVYQAVITNKFKNF